MVHDSMNRCQSESYSSQLLEQFSAFNGTVAVVLWYNIGNKQPTEPLKKHVPMLTFAVDGLTEIFKTTNTCRGISDLHTICCQELPLAAAAMVLYKVLRDIRRQGYGRM